MPDVFLLTDILQFIVYGFNWRPSLERDLILNVHQAVFHVVAKLGDEVYIVNEELLEEGLAAVPLVAEKLSEDFIVKGLMSERFSIIHVPLREHKSRISPLLLMIRWSLNPKNNPMEHCLLVSSP